MKKLIIICLVALFTPFAAHAARFVNNGDGTVTDTRTGLVWEQKTDDGGLRDKDNTYNWKDALAYCENLTLGGQTDWRLPTIKELASLVDLSSYNPSIDTDYFPNTVSSYYWSSSTDAYYTYYAWGVNFYDGYDGWHNKSYGYYVRAVRGGQGGSFDYLVIAMSPVKGPADAGFTLWGTDFTPNSTVTLHFKTQAGAETDTLTANTRSDGSFEVPKYYPNEAMTPGDYVFRAVDNASGQNSSNQVTFIITDGPVPNIGMAPTAGPRGVKFVQWGDGFTANNTATLHFLDGSGAEIGNRTVNIDAVGGFNIEYVPGPTKPAGEYTWYAVDDATGYECVRFTYTITEGDTALTPPTLVEPAANAQLEGTVRFSWSHPYNDEYELIFKDQSGNVVYRSPRLTDKFFDVNLASGSLIEGDSYTWAVLVYANYIADVSAGRAFIYSTVSAGPSIHQSPLQGKAGETDFEQTGSGFTPNNSVKLHFFNSEGQEIGIQNETADSTGAFQTFYHPSPDKPPGIYTWWALDETTGARSNQISYSIIGEGQITVEITVFEFGTGNKLPNLDIKLGTFTQRTNAEGIAIFSGISPGAYNIEIIASGYDPYTDVLNLLSPGSHSKKIPLIPSSIAAGKPYVFNVISDWTGDQSKTVYFLDGVNFNVEFFPTTNWNGTAPGKNRYITPEKQIEHNGTSQKFNMGTDFGPGGRLEIVAVSTTGIESAPYDASIEVMSFPLLPQPPDLISYFLFSVLKSGDQFKYVTNSIKYDLKKNDKSGAAVPADFPIFGGKKIDFKPLFPVTVTIDSKGKAKYKIGDKKLCSFNLGPVDIKMKTAGEIISLYQPETIDWKIIGGSVKFSVSGEQKLPPAYVFVYGFPIYLRGKVGAELDAKLDMYIIDEALEYEGKIKPAAKGKIIAGAGVADVISVEGYLGLKGEFEWIAKRQENLHFDKADLILSGGITITALVVQWEKPLWEYKWNLFDHEGRRTRYYEALDTDNIKWAPISRNYDSGFFQPRNQKRSLRMDDSYTYGQVQTLQSNIYPYSSPYVVNAANGLMLAWITDDMSKTDNNRTSLVFSKFNGNSWSMPEKLSENGTGDFYPHMASFDNGAVIAWQDANSVFANTATLDDMLAGQEISVAVFNNGTNTWGASERLTNNAFLDRSPKIGAAGNKAVAIWISNEFNDMLGTIQKPNKLNCSFFNGSTWSSPQTIADGLSSIIKSAVVYNGGEVVYVFALDQDGDMQTLEDQELYSLTFDGLNWSDPARLTNDDLQDANPQLTYSSSGDLLLAWYKGGDFKMVANLNMNDTQTILTNELSTGAADFRLISGDSGELSIVWADSSSKGQDLYVAAYDPILGIWGDAIQITDTESMERSITASSFNGNLIVVYNDVQMTSEIRYVNAGEEIIEVEAPVMGQADLVMASVSTEGDLHISANDIVVSNDHVQFDNTIDITATVSNQGLIGAENIRVDFYLGDPNAGGELIGSRSMQGILASGESADVTLNQWMLPDMSKRDSDIFIVIDPYNAFSDKDRSNNTAHVQCFKPDLLISDFSSQPIGGATYNVHMSIKNNGMTLANDIPVQFRRNDENGPIIHEETINVLDVNENVDISFDLNVGGARTSDNMEKILAVLNAGQLISELSYENNQDTLYIRTYRINTDNCPNDPNKTNPGACGCGVPDTDSDHDGVPDCIDYCPSDPNKSYSGDCGCGKSDTDTDGDGTADCIDNCPDDPDKINPGICGCGTPDTDTDNDGVPDCNDDGTPDATDKCPNDPNKTNPGICGCGYAETDTDGDGTPDCIDQCPNDPGKTVIGKCGCGTPDIDSDGDNVPDCYDNCPDNPDKTVAGLCGCESPDSDTDGDGTYDCYDGCPGDPEKTAPGICGCGIPDTDSDGDGIPDCKDTNSDDSDDSDDGDDGSDDSGGYPEDRETEKDTGDTNNCFISISFGSGE